MKLKSKNVTKYTVVVCIEKVATLTYPCINTYTLI